MQGQAHLPKGQSCGGYGDIAPFPCNATDGGVNMDNFRAVYKILTALEKAMDLPEFDVMEIGPDALGVSKERWSRYFEMMADVGYIKGVTFRANVLGETVANAKNIRITLKGLEYLQENSIMRKIYNAAKGVVDIIP